MSVRAARAVIVSVGGELLTGEVADTNAGWLGRELERLGLRVMMLATLPDSRPRLARFLSWARVEHDVVVVTGGLGGTRDDVTRAAVADAFGVDRRLDEDLLATFAGITHSARFAEEWCTLPAGSRPVSSVQGGAPAFAIENVYVFPGVPSEMQAAFATVRSEFGDRQARSTWRGVFATTEDRIADVLDTVDRAHTQVRVGSYPRFAPRVEVEIVLRSRSSEAIERAVAALTAQLAEIGVDPAEE